MSDRWRYQIKMGTSTGLYILIFMSIFESREMPFMEQISRPLFYLKAIVYFALGIFVVGYLSWIARQRNSK